MDAASQTHKPLGFAPEGAGWKKPPRRLLRRRGVMLSLRGTTLVCAPFQQHSDQPSFDLLSHDDYSFLGKGPGGNRSLATKSGFPQTPSISSLSAPSFSGYRRCPAGAERACPRMLRGHVPAPPDAAFQRFAALFGRTTARYSPLPRIFSYLTHFGGACQGWFSENSASGAKKRSRKANTVSKYSFGSYR